MDATRHAARAFLLPLALLGGMPALAADINATIRGTVVDQDGLPVPNAGLTLTSPDLLGARSFETRADGAYRFITLPPGRYELRV